MKTSLKSPFSGIKALLLPALLAIVASSGCARSVSLRAPEEEMSSDLERITLAGVSDLRGAAQSKQGESSLEKGGLPLLSSYLEAAKTRPHSAFFVFAAGDLTLGSFESRMEAGSSIVKALAALGVSAASLGPLDFELGIEPLKERAKIAAFPLVLTNLRDSGGTSLFSQVPFAKSAIITQGSVRIGVVSAMSRHFGRTLSSELSRRLEVQDPIDSISNEAHALRRQGAQAIVLLANLGADCDSRRARTHGGNGSTPFKLFKLETAQENCLQSSELSQLLSRLEPDTVDAVISSGSNHTVHHWIRGVPVIQNPANAEQFSFIHLFYDPVQRRIRKAHSRIEGPYGVCASVYANQLDCNERRPAPKAGRGAAVLPVFIGQTIRPSEEILGLLAELEKQSNSAGEKILGQLSQELAPNPTGESALGNWLADSLRERAETDFAILTPGALRGSLPLGKVKSKDIYRALPFDGRISKIHLTGVQLKKLLTILTSGARGFPSVSGLRLQIVALQFAAHSKDLNGDGKIDPWEFDRLLGLKTESGEKLRDSRKYSLALPEFLARGGDDLDWLISQIPPDAIQSVPGLTIRTAAELALVSNTPLSETSRLKFMETPARGKPRRVKARRQH